MKPPGRRAMATRLIDGTRVRVMDGLGLILYWMLTEGDSCPCCGYGLPVRRFCERCDGDLPDSVSAKGNSICRACDWRGDDDPPADGLGISPEQLEGGHCGCDRPRWSRLPCGHCACASECDGCRVNLIWKDEQEAWCGCARPGIEVLPCGHCACGNGLCLELVRNGSTFEARRKVTCS